MTSKHLLVHEVIQTSAMDCGPASLKSLLESFDIHVSYDRLRDACQTDVDGTSLDTLEEIAIQLGLEADQVMLPLDHVLLAQGNALPALAVVRLPNRNLHFVVLWQSHGIFVQVMDPANGRRLIQSKMFLNDLYIHSFPVSCTDWRAWAGTDEFIKPLEQRMLKLKISNKAQKELISCAQKDTDWYSFAVLDAVVRMITQVVNSGGLKPGQQTEQIVQKFYNHVRADRKRITTIPSEYWFVQPKQSENSDDEGLLLMRGALLLRVRGKKTATEKPPAESIEVEPAEDDVTSKALSVELIEAINEPARDPTRELFKLLFMDGVAKPLWTTILAILASAMVVVEALVFWLLMNIWSKMRGTAQDNGIILFAVGLISILLLFNQRMVNMLLIIGQHIEAQLRRIFMYKIPLLGDRYFRSRLRSDMATRSHIIYLVHYFPETLGRIFLTLFELLFTASAMIWISPENTLPIIIAAGTALGVPFLTFPILREQDMRVRIHLGALSHYYLDSLLGLIPLRTHSAERALRHEHENILIAWRKAASRLLHLKIALLGFQLFFVLSSLAWAIVNTLNRNPGTLVILLLAHWWLHLAYLGRDTLRYFQDYLTQRNLTQRLIEPVDAVKTTSTSERAPEENPHTDEEKLPAVAIHMDSVYVHAGGHSILEDISLDIRPGNHVAIIGPSGAGKSSLVGLLLGWHVAAQGELLVDGTAFDEQALARLRRETVWVDPGVQIWNRSLAENLWYGTDQKKDDQKLAWVVEQAELQDVIAKLQQGIYTPLGESGGLVSGGEGQRVRLARGMINSKARLVILDEPFRGLDRKQRHDLITRARALWRSATLICITHDVQETQWFDHVIVMNDGQVIEEGVPAELSNDPGSRYSKILTEEKALQHELWGGAFWQRWQLHQGRVKPAKGILEL